jgi:PPK2 family polyphosphate:nucleotide phosphotransferase
MAIMSRNLDNLLDRSIVPPGRKISLKKDYDPAWEPLKLDKDGAAKWLKKGVEKLAEMQDKLYAQDHWALLLIFQAMDAAGKDGTIKHVMSGLNPQGCDVHSFKAPSAEELDHDYLWRCFKALPERGRIGIFNRSYYEEVLVVKVHPEILAKQKLPEELKDKRIFKRRYEQIRNFERYLYENGIVTVKFFLNVSRQEQKRRFLERIETPEKNWKFSSADAKERAHWGAYQKAYQDCLRATSTRHAPWYVIPADDKALMRVAVANIIIQTLKSLKLAYPKMEAAQERELSEARKVLEAE